MKRKLTYLPIIIVIIFSISCRSGQTRTERPTNPLVIEYNSKLEKYPVMGFKYKGSRLPRKQWNRWIRQTAKTIKAMLRDLPPGYVLQITGHSDSSGPEEPVGNKPGNIQISTNRAKSVYNSLKRIGISMKRITYKGMGSSMLLSEEDPRSPKQRRVTFEIVESEDQLEIEEKVEAEEKEEVEEIKSLDSLEELKNIEKKEKKEKSGSPFIKPIKID